VPVVQDGALVGIVSEADLVPWSWPPTPEPTSCRRPMCLCGLRLMATDPRGSHLRDELGLQPGGLARPLQAAVVSAVSFAVGAVLPLALIVLAPIGIRVPVTALAALVLLALLGRWGGGWVVPRPGGQRCG
jgi:hypothetical protein